MKKLKSVQSWPSRDRLSVCGDVFDDVCEGLPVFGRILREIKTEYDLYVNHLMASQFPQHNMLMNALVEDIGRSKVREKELEEAEKEVCRLEQQATRSLEENKRLRVQHELQNIPATTGPEDRTSADASVWENAALRSDVSSSKRLQVLHVAKEVLQLEEEVQEKLVSRVTTSAAERLLQELKAEIMTLIASNHRLRKMNQDLEIRLHAVLKKEKGSRATGRMLWDQIYEDLHLRETPNCSSDD
uniref:Translin-associated factor X-interacting protein 1 N-terminal domain-containing protein n=1 Tax=Oryzias sinensis TaxID=183150 RepID=A0A8C7YXU8_9TELE